MHLNSRESTKRGSTVLHNGVFTMNFFISFNLSTLWDSLHLCCLEYKESITKLISGMWLWPLTASCALQRCPTTQNSHEHNPPHSKGKQHHTLLPDQHPPQWDGMCIATWWDIQRASSCNECQIPGIESAWRPQLFKCYTCKGPSEVFFKFVAK